MLTPQAFAEKWAGAALSEHASYQQHFLDLCAMLEAPASAEADPRGEFYAFEKGVEKTGGGKGLADVWYENHFAFEYKGRQKDLGAAYGQLLQGASEAELKKRTLTNLYNARPTWLANAHNRLDAKGKSAGGSGSIKGKAKRAGKEFRK